MTYTVYNHLFVI